MSAPSTEAQPSVTDTTDLNAEYGQSADGLLLARVGDTIFAMTPAFAGRLWQRQSGGSLGITA